MLVIIGRDDRNVQQQEEEEESGSSSSSSSSGEESDSEDGLPFSMSRAGYVVVCVSSSTPRIMPFYRV